MDGLLAKSEIFFKKNSSTILTCIGAIGVAATAVMAVKATPKAIAMLDKAKEEKGEELTKLETFKVAAPAYIPATVVGVSTIACIFGANILNKKQQASLMSAYALVDNYYKEYKNSLIVWSLGEGTTMDLVGSIVQHGDEKLKIVKDILDGGTSIEELKDIKEVLQGCPADKFDKVKDLVNKLASEDTNIKDNDEIPLNDNDETDVVVVPKTYELEVEDFEGHLQTVRIDQVQYAGLSLDEIERYVGEAKDAVVKYFRELNEKQNLGLQFDVERIAKHSYSQLYGIRDRNGKDIPIVVHSYKGPQYRYFDLNWYDWQLLSQKGAMLFVLTATGLQCIPLYALPVRNVNIPISNDMSTENRAALLTLAAVGKQYSTLSFDFGNNMPQGFNDPVPFDYVPEQLGKCITSIKEVCDQNVPQIANLYNNGRNIPIVRSSVGYSLAMAAVNEGNARDVFDAPANDTQAPSVGTSFID